MTRLLKLLIPIGLVLTAGCVVAPAGPGYYGARVAVVAPAPVVLVRPHGWYHYGW